MEKRMALLCIVLALTLVSASFVAQDVGSAASTGGESDAHSEVTYDIGEEETIVSKPNPIVTIEMESGDIMRLELYPDVAPNTVANFISLVEDGFYDGLIFHRVIPRFMIQGGCPNGTGTGGPGYNIVGEFRVNGYTNDLMHTRGVISMARAQGSNTGGCQFFVMHADAPHLDGKYAAFGKLLDEASYETLDKIAATRTNAQDKPLLEWKMKTVTVDTGGVEYEVEKLR